MEFKEISSKDNSLIKLVSALQTSSKARKENKLFVLEGLRICDDAFLAGIRFDKLILSKTALNKQEEKIKIFAENSNQIFVLPDSLFKKISDTASPQGIIAVCSFEDTLKKDFNKNGRYVGLENLSDPSNLGAISRTAEALGLDGIIISSDSCDPYNPKVLRASMGTLLRMPIFMTDDIITFAKQKGLKSYSCVVDRNARKIADVDFSDGCVVLIGNEANGLKNETVENSDCAVTITMRGSAESLNAAAAASIAMWEMMR